MNLYLPSVASNWTVTNPTITSGKFTNAYTDYFALICSKLYNPLLFIFWVFSGDSRA